VGPTQNQIESNLILFLRPRAGDDAPLPASPGDLGSGDLSSGTVRGPRLRRTLATAALRVRLYGPDDRAPPMD
jgi:hypothetical protein